MEVSPTSFDLEAYASRYEGRTKIQRLRYIAACSPELRSDALRMAVIEAKKGFDTSLYKDIHTQAQGIPGVDFEKDEIWIRTKDQWASQELGKLRYDLEDNRQQANKEVIRTGHSDLGDFFHKRGKLVQARGEIVKTRDYCAHPIHSLHMCMKVITVSIEADDFVHVENHYMMAENIPDVDKSGPEIAQMRACAGLASLVRGSYQSATQRFLSVNMESSEEKIAVLQKEFGDILSLEDVATYGSLCALATLDRAGLTKMVMERLAFRNLLELVPDVREVVFDFYHSRYARCLGTMARLKGELRLDMYLGRDDHVDNLYRLIRRKALMQYVSPFISVDLTKMEKVFGTEREELQEELLGMIENGMIQARIDTQNGALHAKRTNRRLQAMAGALERGQEAFEDEEIMLLRMTLMKNEVCVTGNGMVSDGGVLGLGGGGLGGRGRSISSIADNVFERGMRQG